jgi:hypothetical protein
LTRKRVIEKFGGYLSVTWHRRSVTKPESDFRNKIQTPDKGIRVSEILFIVKTLYFFKANACQGRFLFVLETMAGVKRRLGR